jgi:hypothetical protein
MARCAVAGSVVVWLTAALHAQMVEPVKAHDLERVNTAGDEDEPYSTVNADGIGRLYYLSKNELFVAQRTAKGWQAGKPCAEFEERGDYRGVFISFPKTGTFPQTILWATNADHSKPDGRGDNFDIYMRVKKGQGGSGSDFTVVLPLHAVSTREDEMHPWLTADGELFFSRKTKEGWRVFVSHRPKPDRQFEKPVMVDLPVGFHHATLTPEGRTMYLQGPLPNNRSGLFRSHLVAGKWSEPEELASLNHPDAPIGDRSPSLSRNGSILFFASDRPGGKGGLDIWYVATEQLRKKSP